VIWVYATMLPSCLTTVRYLVSQDTACGNTRGLQPHREGNNRAATNSLQSTGSADASSSTTAVTNSGNSHAGKGSSAGHGGRKGIKGSALNGLALLRMHVELLRAAKVLRGLMMHIYPTYQNDSPFENVVIWLFLSRNHFTTVHLKCCSSKL
jgi:hypothetical protein